MAVINYLASREKEAVVPIYISDLKVMRSAAGWYIGRDYYDPDEPWTSPDRPCPYSRESGYFASEEEAKTALRDGFSVRNCVENNWAYESGSLPDIREIAGRKPEGGA